jgi:hypothetical protein
MAVPSRKEEQYFMFWRLLFLFSSSVYVVLYTAALDTVEFLPSGTLTVRTAAKYFKATPVRSFPLSLAVGEVRGT